MTISSVWSATAAGGTAGTGTAPANSVAGMGTNEFMLMLMAQLKNQNPLEPMDDKDLMGQVASLNSLQELQVIKARMEQVATANQASYAASLIGKTVTANLKDGETVEGKVTGTAYVDGEISVLVGEQAIPLSAVVAVHEGE